MEELERSPGFGSSTVDILQAKAPGGIKFLKVSLQPRQCQGAKKSGPPQEPLLSVNNPICNFKLLPGYKTTLRNIMFKEIGTKNPLEFGKILIGFGQAED